MEPTPPGSDAHEELSESQFNYEMQNNWSMIFTDDNNSTDHDLRSNYSSSVDEAEADNDIELVSESGIVSETDSEYPAFRYLSSRNKEESSATLKTVQELGADSQELSTATLKNSVTENMEGEYHFPDPLSGSKEMKPLKKKTPLDTRARGEKKETEAPLQNHPVLAQLKSYAVYVVLGILVLDRSIQLFDLSLPSSKWIFGANATPQVLPTIGVTCQDDDDSFNPVTVIRYTTKTETYFIPDHTTSVETVYQTAEPTMIPSWALVKQLYANFVSDGRAVGESLWMKANEVSEKATLSAKETLYEVPEWIHAQYDSFADAVGDSEELMTSISLYAKDKYAESIAVLSDWTKAAAKSAVSIRDEGIGHDIKQWLSTAQDQLFSAWNFARDDGVSVLSTSLKSLYISSGKALHMFKRDTFSLFGAVGTSVSELMHDPIWMDVKHKSIEATESGWSKLNGLCTELYDGAESKLSSYVEMKDHASDFALSVRKGVSQTMFLLNEQLSDLRKSLVDNEEDATSLKKTVDRQMDNASRAAWSTWKWFTYP